MRMPDRGDSRNARYSQKKQSCPVSMAELLQMWADTVSKIRNYVVTTELWK